MKKDFSILIGGAAGEGSKKAGLVIAKFFSNYGYNVYIYEDYQSLIKGGHNCSLIRVSDKKISSIKDKIDFLLALNEDTITRHIKKVVDKKHIIFNLDAISFKYGVGVPIEKITEQEGGISIMKNTALIAAFGKMIGIEWSTIKKVLEKELPIATDLNLKIAEKSYKEADVIISIEKNKSIVKPLVSGNEAIALGALSAGLEAYVSYPMTPATGVLNYMASTAINNKLIVFQPENEISVVNTAIGLAFSGKKTMVGTSGGGFGLMNEGVSFSAQSETPLVIVEAQRMGPSTGVPTYNGQSDLLHVLSSGHGDLLRFIVAPGDVEEAFSLTALAINISWKYQIPSIILSDKDLSESTFTLDEVKVESISPVIWDKKQDYLRYKNSKDGISPLAFPGDKNAVIKVTSYEHNEKGIAVEDAKSIKEMQDKRLKKYNSLIKEVQKMKCVNIYGNKKSKKAIIVWGSNKGVAMEVGEKLGIKVIQILVFQPFPEKEVKKALMGVNKLIAVETNTTGQMVQVLKSFGIKTDKIILKYDGRPFTVQELEKKVK
jgi:2-oxoglutarate/2-oxoacid ferredoxin oxidoreductase subunit alpha